jgi:hypothetical protein
LISNCLVDDAKLLFFSYIISENNDYLAISPLMDTLTAQLSKISHEIFLSGLEFNQQEFEELVSKSKQTHTLIFSCCKWLPAEECKFDQMDDSKITKLSFQFCGNGQKGMLYVFIG